MADLVKDAKIDTGEVRVGVVIYRKKGARVFPLSQYTDATSLQNALRNMRIRRGTFTNAASGMDVVRTNLLTPANGDRADAPNVVVVITDANSKTDVQKIPRAANQLKASVEAVYAIGTGMSSSSDLSQMASSTSNLHFLDSFAEFASIREEMVDEIYALQGEHAEPTTEAPMIPTSGQDSGEIMPYGTDKLDLVFLYHASQNIDDEGWETYKLFMSDVISGANIDSGEVRVGAVVYNRNSYMAFPLNQYRTSMDLERGLEVLPVDKANDASIASGLDVVRRNVFTSGTGDRPDAPNAVIVITDSDSYLDRDKIASSAQRLRTESGARIYTAGIGLSGSSQLSTVASSTSTMFPANRPEDLADVRLGLVRQLPPLSRRQDESGADPVAESYGSDKLDLVFLFHASSNIDSDGWENYKLFMNDVISGANIDNGDVRVGAVLYNYQSQMYFPLRQYQTTSSLAGAINDLNFQSSPYTNLAGGMDLVRQMLFSPTNGDRPDAPNAVIIVSDADSNYGQDRLESSAERLKTESQARIYTAGIGLRGSSEMSSVASSGSTVFSPDNVAGLTDVKEELVAQIPPLRRKQEQPTTSSTDQGSSASEPYGTDKLDLLFLLHTSNNIDDNGWENYKNFINDVVSGANIDNGNVQVSVADYNARSKMYFSMYEHNTASKLATAIGNLNLMRSDDANLGLGLNLARQMVFTSSSGDRPDVPNAVIVLTDSDANLFPDYIADYAEQLRTESQARIYTVGIGLRGSSQLSSIASAGSTMFAPDNLSGLAGVKEGLVAQMPPLTQRLDQPTTDSTDQASSGSTAFYPANAQGLTGVKEQLVSQIPPLRQRPEQPPIDTASPDQGSASIVPYGSDKLDLVYLFHMSQNMDRQGWENYKLFMKNVISGANVDSGDVRVSAVIYNTRSQMYFPLNQYQSVSELNGAIDNLPYLPSSTSDFSQGLRYVSQMAFTPMNGDRPDVPNAVIVVTDSDANINQGNVAAAAENVRTVSGARIYTVGIGVTGNSHLASSASARSTVFSADDAYGLAGVKDQLVAQIPPLGGGQDQSATDSSSDQEPYGSDKLDLVYMFHTSNNIDNAGWEHYKGFMYGVVSDANIDNGDVRVGALVYNDRSSMHFPLGQYRTASEVAGAINGMKFEPSDNANVAAGMNEVRQRMFIQSNGDRPDAPNAVIVVTDADANLEEDGIASSADRLKTESGARVYTAGIGLKDSAQLPVIASDPSTAFMADDPAGLSDVKEDLVKQMPPLSKKQDQSTGAPSSTDQGAPDRTEATADTSEKLDLAFLIHTSEDIDYEKYDYYSKFMHKIVDEADVDSGDVRVGAVIYNEDGEVVFPLDKYTSNEAVQAAIIEFPLSKSPDANIAKGMDTVREKLFTPEGGDRPDVPNAVIVVTDADSNLDEDKIAPAAQKLKDESKAKVFTAGIGLLGASQLPIVATAPEDMYEPETVEELPDMRDPIVEKTPALRGGGLDLHGHHRQGQDPRKLDLAFLVHASEQIDGRKYQDYKDYMRDVLENADVDSGAVRAGVVLYRHDGTVMIQLDRFLTKNSLTEAIGQLPLMASKYADLAKGMDVVRQDFFSPEKGDREDAPNGVIILTDADSNLNEGDIPRYAHMLRDSGARIVTAGIGLAASDQLPHVASDKSALLGISDVGELPWVVEPAQEQFPPLLGVMTTFVPSTSEAITETDEAATENAQTTEGVMIDPAEGTTQMSTSTEREAETSESQSSTQGEPKSTEATADTSEKLDLAFLIHTSEDIDYEKYDYYSKFMHKIVDEADVDSGDVRVGAVIYNEDGEVVFPLDKYTSNEAVQAAIIEFPLAKSPDANIAKGMDTVREKLFTPEGGDRPDVPNAVIVVTDADSNLDEDKIAPAAQKLKDESKAKVFTAGIGLLGASQLPIVATAPEDMYEPETVEELPDVRDPIVEKTPALRGGGLDLHGHHRAGQDPRKLDLAFLVHASEQIDGRKYQDYKDYMRDVLENADVDSGAVRAGVVLYRHDGTVMIQLDRFLTKNSLTEAIGQLPLMASKYADLAKGMDVVRQDFFSPEKGDREDAPNGVIILTDADSNLNEEEIPRYAHMLRDSGARIVTAGIGLAASDQLPHVASDKSALLGISDVGELPWVVEPAQEQFPPLLGAMTTFVPSTTGVVTETEGTTLEIEKTTEGVIIDPTEAKTQMPTSTEREVETTESQLSTQGEPKSTEATADTSEKLDLAFLIHTSEDIDYEKYDYYSKFMHKIVDEADIDSGDVRVGAVIYNEDGEVVFPLDKYTSNEAVQAAIIEFPLSKSPDANIAKGMDTVREKLFTPEGGDRPDVPNAVIVVTDADSNLDDDKIAPAAQKLKDESKAKVFTAGIGLLGASQLPIVATAPEDMYEPETVEELPDVRDPIVEKTPALRGGALDLHGHHRDGQDPKKLDLAFLVHTSKDIDGDKYRDLKDYMRDVVDNADIDSGAVRAGVVLYRHDGTVMIPLYRFLTKSSLQAAIGQLPLMPSDFADLAKGMEVVRKNFFNPEVGDREDAPNGVIILTDADANLNEGDIPRYAHMLRDSGARIVTAGIGLAASDQLPHVASDKSALLGISDVGELPWIVDPAREQFPPLNPESQTTMMPTSTAGDTTAVSEPETTIIPTAEGQWKLRI
ncbi:collagen alpha-3(VI) chain [Elysia marginata]|uniref:Collagen alpha-3(VI) chain n=1 Tax=Elysia marginata TaxID=1093978 RepID=A0AAV4FXD0_9GAST|nr:collagen alpha-3(VI) chain [Elysia marginata]